MQLSTIILITYSQVNMFFFLNCNMRIVGDFVTFLSLFTIKSLEKFGYHLQPGCAHSEMCPV